MSKHTYLLDLPDVLEGLGLNVEVAEDWELGQGAYKWTNPHTGEWGWDEKPWGYMVHHSAGSAATPPSHDKSKASAWIGLKRNGRLYQEGGGIPTIYLASAGPARISSGYGWRPALWDYVFKELRAPAHAQGPDSDTAGNRYTFNMETVHRGDGSPIDDGVLQHVIGLGIALEAMTGLKEMTLGHTSWSRRKIDPYWNNDSDCIIKVQESVADGSLTTGGTVLFQIGEEHAEYEEISWLLYILEGGTVDPNGWSGQIESKLPWKNNVRLVAEEDFDLIARYTKMSDKTKANLKTNGLYRFGKEIAALREYAYREDS